ncbi:MAG: carboxylesterase family protein [Pseudomonadota bacterium]
MLKRLGIAALILAIIGAGALWFLTRPAAPMVPSPTVQLTTGDVAGGWADEEQTVAVYNGLPFAAPPVGDLRWRSPIDPIAWSGVRDGRDFGAECLQHRAGTAEFVNDIVRGHGLGWVELQLAKLVVAFAPDPVESEDCLFLNVRTANLGQTPLQPVMVWIHGGSHQTGTGATDLYQANGLVEKGVVLVTINYRLGPFGYLAHPSLSADDSDGVSGNYGLLDQIKALEWVEANIAAFGGDPGNVTIFGESAGAQSVSEIMASPLSDGLYDKAILQSGSSTYNRIHLAADIETTPSAESVGQEFLGPLLPDDAIAATAAELRTLPADAILARIPEAQHLTGFFLPNVDGYVLPRMIGEVIDDQSALTVPVLAGYNADEGTLFYPYFKKPTVLHRGAYPTGQQDRLDQLTSLYGEEDATGLTELYNLTADADWDAGAQDMLGDDMFGVHMRFLARNNAEAGLPTWLYFFSRTPPKPKQTLGAYHASEIAFVFDSHIKLLGFTDADASLTDIMTRYWTNFAKTGDPNSGEVPAWPTYSADDQWMHLAHDLEVLQGVRKDKLDIMERLLAAKLETSKTLSEEVRGVAEQPLIEEQAGTDALQP